MLKRLKAVGPGALAAAAFIGPGTVTTATVAGAGYGYALVWCLVFATIATIILQEMALRVGVIAQKGLGQAILSAFEDAPPVKWAMAGLILAALFVGNAAYEGGNLAGAALGLEAALGDRVPRAALVLAIAGAAALLLWRGRYKTLERALVAMVVFMSLCFAAAAFMVRPDFGALASSFAPPRLPNGAFFVALALIGTTIVPYNLFLHAAAARTRWATADSLKEARFDAAFSIGAGGAVSILVLITAAAGLFGAGVAISSAADMARQLEPAFGDAATWLVAGGLFAAGLTSAITAPLATAYAASEIFGFESRPGAPPFRAVALSVVAIGAMAAIFGGTPVAIILFAQFANGLLLPVVAAFLVYAVNRRALLGDKTNGAAANIAGGAVIVLTAGLGLRALARVFGLF